MKTKICIFLMVMLSVANMIKAQKININDTVEVANGIINRIPIQIDEGSYNYQIKVEFDLFLPDNVEFVDATYNCHYQNLNGFNDVFKYGESLSDGSGEIGINDDHSYHISFCKTRDENNYKIHLNILNDFTEGYAFLKNIKANDQNIDELTICLLKTDNPIEPYILFNEHTYYSSHEDYTHSNAEIIDDEYEYYLSMSFFYDEKKEFRSYADGYEIDDWADSHCGSSGDIFSTTVSSIVDDVSNWKYRKPNTITISPSFINYKPKDISNWFHFVGTSICIEGLKNLNTSEVTKMIEVFSGCYELDLSHFVTSNVTDMYGMFSRCEDNNLDLTSFNTINVTNMSKMFEHCQKLSSLNLCSFNTLKVTNLSGMFANCNNLKNLDISSFNVSNVTDMSSLFEECNSLENIDISHFDTSNLLYSSKMLYNCTNLKQLSISSTMKNLAEDACVGVGTKESPCEIIAPEGFDFGVDTSGDYFIWKGGHFTIDTGEGIKNYALLSTDGKKLTFYHDDKRSTKEGVALSLNAEGQKPLWLEWSPENITEIEFDESFIDVRPNTLYQWFNGLEGLKRIVNIKYLNLSESTDLTSLFEGCSSLESIDMSQCNLSKVRNLDKLFKNCSSLITVNLNKVNTERVTSMSQMFYGCTNLTNINLNDFNTSVVRDMSYMFMNCSKLMNINFSSFNTKWVSNMNRMFAGCNSLESLNLGNFDTSNVTDYSYMMANCSGLEWLSVSATMTNLTNGACNGIGTEASPCELRIPEGTDFGIDTSGEWFTWKGGYFYVNPTPLKSYAQLYNGILYFYYDREKESRPGTIYSIPTTATTPEWATSASSVTKVIFDASFEEFRPTSTYQWFDGMTNLASIEGIEYLNTSAVTSMYCMFNKCANLQKLDLSHFDTRKVTSMTAMMANCTNLREVNLEGFNTSAATSIRMMFQNCSSLTAVELSSFDLSNCTDIRKLFEGCTSLEAVDFSNFNVQPGTNTTNLLYNCSALKTLILSDSMEGINSTACKGVGTASNPCTISAPSTFDFGVDTSANSFLWKGGYFHLLIPATIALNTVSLQPGSTAQLPINLNNGTDMTYNGYQFDLQLPSGVTLAKNGNKWLYTLGDRYSDEGMTVSFNDLGNGKYRVVCLSMSNVTITGTSGTLLSLTLKAAEDAEIGDYSGTISNFTLSTVDKVSVKVDDTNFIITISAFDPGDVNHDGVVNVTDVMATIQYILGTNPPNYDESLADMNNDGNIDVTDAMAMVLVILDSNVSGAPACAITSYETLTLAPNANGFDITSAGEFTACQMTVTLPEGGSISNVSTTAGGKAFVKKIADNRYNVVVYSQEGMPLTKDGAFIQLRTHGNTNGISINNIQLTDRSLKTIILDETNGIIEIANNEQGGDFYNIQGMKVKTPNRGIYIRNGKKQTVK